MVSTYLKRVAFLILHAFAKLKNVPRENYIVSQKQVLGSPHYLAKYKKNGNTATAGSSGHEPRLFTKAT